MRKFILLIALGFGSLALQAQTDAPVKIGYADWNYIFTQMPEFKQVDTELKSTQNMLKTQIESKAKEFQTKLEDYNANVNNMLDAVRANTERELRQLQENLDRLQQDAQMTIQKKETQLMEPIYAKVGKAIEDVAKENGFTLILSQQIGGLEVVLYGDEKMDVSDLVLKKMGITPTPKTDSKPQN